MHLSVPFRPNALGPRCLFREGFLARPSIEIRISFQNMYLRFVELSSLPAMAADINKEELGRQRPTQCNFGRLRRSRCRSHTTRLQVEGRFA